MYICNSNSWKGLLMAANILRHGLLFDNPAGLLVGYNMTAFSMDK